MRALIKEWFDLWVKMRWLKTIDKETEKFKKLNAKTNRQLHVVNSLVKRYREIYDVDLREKESESK